MANIPSSFEQMVMNHGPVQISLIRNLTRWEFRNLQLAGVRVPVHQKLQRKYLIPDRCDEWDPEESTGAMKRCTNTTERYDIRACSGSPLCISQRSFLLEKRIEDEEIKPCLRIRRQKNSPENGPNAKKYPIHTKVCRKCRNFYAARARDNQLATIAGFRTPLCKGHSLELANQLPLNACRCLDYIHDKWRCSICTGDTLYYMNARAFLSRTDLTEKKIPWYRPYAYLKSRFWVSQGMLCPIEGCFQQAWLYGDEERMQLCLGCDTICWI